MKLVPLFLVALAAAFLGALLGIFVVPARPAVTTGNLEPSAMYARVSGAVRTVRSSNAQLSSEDLKGYGTAFHIGDGYYVTAAHVVADGYQFYLDAGAHLVERLENNQGITKVKVIAKDAISDLALLKGEPAPVALSWATVAPVVGDAAYAIGNPFARAPGSLTHGMVSGLDRIFPTERGTLTGMLQMDTPVNPGNSGGPLLNSSGQVIGVVSAILAPAAQSAGVGFAVPANKAKPIIEALRDTGTVQHPALGVIGANESAPRVVAVQPGGNAARAGVQAGDLVLRVNDVEVGSFSDLTAIIAAFAPGDKLSLVVQRGDQLKTLSVVLESP